MTNFGRTIFPEKAFNETNDCNVATTIEIFINKDFKPVLEKALRNLMTRGLTKELKTWDGVFVIRTKRALTSLSLHSWAIAVDVNRAENDLHMIPKLSSEFVKCFTDAGCEWGGFWKNRPDGMHFQLNKI